MGYLDKLKPVGTSTQSNMPATLSYKDKLQPVSHETVTREKTGLAKTAGAFNTVFGGGKIGEYIGTKAAYAFASPEERKYIDQTTPSSGEIIGSALQSAALFTPFGKIAQGLGVGAKAIGLGTKIASRIGNVGAGATGGYAFDVGSGLAQKEETPFTPGVATALGAVAPIVAGALKKGAGMFAERGARKAEELRLLKGELPPPPPGAPPAGPSTPPTGPIAGARIATKTLDESGKVVTDKVGKEAVRQGIPEADVALIKAGTAGDKAKMSKMLDIRQSQLTNKRVTDRATDVVGDTFVEKIAKPIEKLNKEAGQKLELVARRLAGKKVDPSPAVTKFGTSLENSGITVRKNGTLNFKNSNFEGLKGAQTLITNVWNRAIRVARTGDALQLHRTKSYIDEIVNYGKQVDGLSGKAQTMLKQFRHDIDGILDSRFPSYNQVNTQFADTITQLNNMGAAIGRTFKLGDTFADAQAGLAMRRILSNTASRSEILKLLENMQKVGQKYGIKIDEDIITQSNFADVLEKMLGSEAPTSFLGQGERFAGQALSAGGDIARGTPSGIISGTIKAGKYAIDVTRGINQENKINALRALLKNAQKLSNFGVTK